jgi:hypothetical protein
VTEAQPLDPGPDNACGDNGRRRLRLGEDVIRQLTKLSAGRYGVLSAIEALVIVVAIELITGRSLGTAVGTAAWLCVVCGVVAGAARTTIGPKRPERTTQRRRSRR